MRKILLLTAVLTFMLLLTVAIGEEKTMGVGQINVFADAGVKGVSYSSDDPSVARVDAVSGRISAVTPGVCTLTGVVDGEIVYTLELTVLKAPSSISVTDKSVQMMQGSYMKPQNAIIAEGEWAGDIEVRTTGEAISMTPDGMIYARVTGSGMVYMRTYNGLSVKYEIKVRDKPAQIVFAETDIHMGLGESRFLSYTLLPQYSYGRVSFELEGDTDAIAFDEGTLQVTGKGIGSLTITAMCESGVSETIRVYVLPLPEHLTETTPIDTAEGLTGTIPKPLPGGTFAFFEYESLTPDVIQVDSSGRWQALKGGTGRVRLHALETELYAEQEFFVLPMPTSVSIDVPSVKMYISETFRCEATVLPEGALDHLTWKSSNPGCVSVDAEGRLTALTYGSAVISATADNGLSDSVTITVPKLPTYMEMGIKYAELKTGENAELYCTFSKDTYAKVTYASLDEDIAAVDRESGRVTGAGFGTTAIVATSSNGLTAACLVTVTGDSTPREQELEAVFLDVDSNDA
ncbi:MAG: Ig-like domain-containing protein, partial [Clostridia bacterium]|nr:Ig-like domain-containing protein [Clostridia bacterium]